jgi:hypothetical protein
MSVLRVAGSIARSRSLVPVDAGRVPSPDP